MNDEARYYQIMKDYESFLGIKLINQQVDQLRQAKSAQNNLDAQNSRSGGTAGISSGMRSSDYYSSTSDRMGSIAQSRVSKQNTGKKEGGEDNARLIDVEGSAMESVISQGTAHPPDLGNEKARNEQALEVERMQEQMREDEQDN